MKRIALSALALTFAAAHVGFAQAPTPKPLNARQQAAVQRLVHPTRPGPQANVQAQQRAEAARRIAPPSQQFASPRAREFRQFNPNANAPAANPNPTPNFQSQQRVFNPNTTGSREGRRRNWNNPNQNVDPDNTGAASEFADRGSWQERNRDNREWNRQAWRNRNWDRTRRDRRWWRSHYDRFALFGGGYYYWDRGYWYPAYGYDPYFSSYTYDAPIYAYENQDPGQVIAGVQSALQQQGYYRGAVDGTYGPMTRRALLGFQRDNGLPQTGQIDQDTLGVLGME